MQAFFDEYGVLIAFAIPVVLIVGMQVALLIAGESGTLLIPSLKPFESGSCGEEETGPQPALDEDGACPAPAVEETERKAA